jgi:HSP20 family protein
MYNRKFYGVSPRTIGGLIEDVFQNGWHRINEEVSAFTAPVNIRETDNGYDLHVIAPGLKKEDFKINLDRNIISIAYEPKEESKEQNDGNKWLRSEYRMKSFKRSFTLNDKIDAGKIGARYDNGILVVSLPKKDVTEMPVHEISVN